MSKDALLNVQNVTKRFGGLIAVNNVTFNINKGEIVGLIGPNGAGKTTLYNVLTGFYKLDGGTVYFMDKNITGLPPHMICNMGIARTFQIVKPFSKLTVRDAVKVGAFCKAKSKSEANETINKVLNYLDISRIEDTLCKDLNFIQLKLVEFARALATNPILVLLDEPASGLNPVEIDHFIALLKRLNKEWEITICLVEHVMRFVMGVSERVIVLHHGEKIAEGTPKEVANNSQVIKAYLGERWV